MNQICEKAISKESRFGPGTIITELNIPANKCGLVIGKGKFAWPDPVPDISMLFSFLVSFVVMYCSFCQNLLSGLKLVKFLMKHKISFVL